MPWSPGPVTAAGSAGPGGHFGTKGSHFFPSQAARLPVQSQLSAACLPGTATPLLIPTAAAFSHGIPWPVRGRFISALFLRLELCKAL